MQCLFTAHSAKTTQRELENYLNKENKIKSVDHKALLTLCDDLLQDFHSLVLDYDEQAKIMTIHVNGQIKVQLYEQLMKINKYREHTLSELNFLINFCQKNGYLSGINSLIKELNDDKFKVQLTHESSENLFDLSDEYYQHHYWHLSRKNSFKIYFNFIEFMISLGDKIKPFNKTNYIKLNEFLQNTIPDLFILVGEIDLDHSDSTNLPVLIKDQKFHNDSPEKFYNRILEYGDDEYWCLTNSLTELNSFIKFITIDNLNLKSFPKVFELEFLRNVKIGIPDFHCRKYQNSNILLIQVRDKEYQFELIEGNLADYQESYEPILDYEQ